MRKQTIIITMTILLLSFASAMYGGECNELDLSELDNLDNVVYMSVGNQSDLDGLNITINGSYVTICAASNYMPDNFTIVFLDNSTDKEEVIVYRSSGRRTKYIEKNVTEFIEVNEVIRINCSDDKPVGCERIEVETEEIEVGILRKIWNWVIGLFSNGDIKATEDVCTYNRDI